MSIARLFGLSAKTATSLLAHEKQHFELCAKITSTIARCNSNSAPSYTDLYARTVTGRSPFSRSEEQSTPDSERNQEATMSAESENCKARRVVTAPNAPAAIGPYSHAIQAGGNLYISGQLGMDPNSGELVSGGVEKEAEQALKNLGAILHAAQGDYKNVVKTTVLLADIKDFQAVNQIYARFFTHDPPARAAYQVAALPKNARVEIEAVAYLG